MHKLVWVIATLSSSAIAQASATAGSMTLDQFLARQGEHIVSADSDGDGRVSKAEMVAAARGGRDPSRLFDRMDANHDDYLDVAEIKAVLTRRFQRMDTNGDGVVTAEERMAARPAGGRRGARPAKAADPAGPQ